MRRILIGMAFVLWHLLSANATFAYTHADTLRGGNGTGRRWWDVQHYDLNVAFNMAAKSISGSVDISFTTTGRPGDSMQIDLQEPMVMDSVFLIDMGAVPLSNFTKQGNVWWLQNPSFLFLAPRQYTIRVHFHGSPRIAVNPPWDGGFSWKSDDKGKPWVAVSCQGLGASVWWPCKDAQWDEPDSGMTLTFSGLDGLTAVSNGRQVQTSTGANRQSWKVTNPINSYDATFYIGDYIHWQDTLIGENGLLDLSYWVLRGNEQKARKQFAVVKPMLHCFEHWMGPYPFYEDGYKLVDAPYLGMEHQSAIAYGNSYQMGYRGYDRTRTGIGMLFDYIIVHESGHEWFGNNVTARDMADNWIHESITTYSESLFAECLLGKEKGQEYCRGEWHDIRNDVPMIGNYGVNEEGSGDIYDKGTAMMHMIRTLTADDERFREMLRGLNREFYHQTVTTAQVEAYISTNTGLDLTAFFNQYLRTAVIPELEYYVKKGMLYYKFNNSVAGFSLPLPVSSGRATATLQPGADWQHIKWNGGQTLKVSPDFLVTIK